MPDVYAETRERIERSLGPDPKRPGAYWHMLADWDGWAAWVDLSVGDRRATPRPRRDWALCS